MELTTKKVNSPLEKWKGYIVIYDPLPLAKLAMFEDAIQEALEVDPKLSKASAIYKLIPSLLECVKEWNIENIPSDLSIENFPSVGTGLTRKDIAEFVNWVANIFIGFFQGKDPNE